jgi:SAM-dependent methyltransferase
MPTRVQIDKLAPTFIVGWAWNPDAPAACVSIQVRVGDEMVGSAIADGFRRDLLRANIGSGYHAFVIMFTRALTSDELDKLAVIIMDAGQSPAISLKHVSVDRSGLPPPAQPKSIGEQVRGLMKFSPAYAESPQPDQPSMSPSQLVQTLDLEGEIGGSEELKVLLEKSGLNVGGLAAAMKRDTRPIPSSSNREGYASGRDLAYWLSGYAQFKMISDFAMPHGVRGGRYFDFGGSTGRVSRHFAFQSMDWDVWLCDFKSVSIDFCLKYLPGVRSFCNTSFPSLPIEDQCFDLISALSVFTHINESELSWLLELRRVLAKGGIACITVVNDECWSNPDRVLKDSIKGFRPDLMNVKTIPEGKTVIAFRDDDPYNCNVTHSNSYIRDVWGRFLDIRAIIPRYSTSQSMVICSRRD